MKLSTIAAGATGSKGRRLKAQLILRDVTVIDGTGAPAYGPATVVIKDGRIDAVLSAGRNTDMTQAGSRLRIGSDDVVLDLPDHYVLPGLIDAHAHIAAAEQGPSADYSYLLWLGHGITTVREPGCLGNGLDFVRDEARRSADNDISAPRIVPYAAFGDGRSEPFRTAREAEEWVSDAAERGAKGVKFFGASPAVFSAALAEANRLGLGSACHHAASDVARVNALTTARWGLTSIEHGYGLPEAMFSDRRVQDFPSAYNYNNEHHRFAALGQLWRQAAEPHSRVWNETLDELVSLGTTLDPTFAVYVAARDAARARTHEYHDDYLSPQGQKFFAPDPASHGSFFYDWGTEEEVAWKGNFRLWMAFIRDFHLRGGRVTLGSDAGFVHTLYGFGLIEEMELMREAGFHPLEIINCATAQGAELLGVSDERGTVEPGMAADLLVVTENPLANLKVLYGHGHQRTAGDGTVSRVGGVAYTIKDGIVFDAAQLRADVRDTVAEARAKHAADTAHT